jgi:hypothetical protein
MIIQHFKYPFAHTIIYGIFDEVELTQIHNEVNEFIKNNVINATDKHHAHLFNKNKTTSLCLDEVYVNARDSSNILNLIQKVYTINLRGALTSNDNPFLKYITHSNHDNTYLQLYRAGSSYFEHHDKSVLTFLYPFKSKSTGGNLVFTDYDYTPYLSDNCCLIFPGFEQHLLTTVESDSKDDVVRFSINQRIYINPQ